MDCFNCGATTKEVGVIYTLQCGAGVCLKCMKELSNEVAKNFLGYDDEYYGETDGFRDDVDADADVLRTAGWGTDEDYGYYGNEDGAW